MKKIIKIILIISLIVFVVDFFTLINQSVSVSEFWRDIGKYIANGSLIVFILSVFYLFISWLINIFKKRKELKSGQPEISNKESLEKPKEKKEWQPVNIVLGLLIIGCAFYFSFPKSSFIAIARLIPAILLIFTKKNNLFVFIVLILFSATLLLLPTLDAFLILVSAIYMFFSSILRTLKVKRYIAIGLIIASIFGLWMFKEMIFDKMQSYAPQGMNLKKELSGSNSIELISFNNEVSTEFNKGQVIYPRETGLQKGVKYACMVVSKAGLVIPLDRWPIFKSDRSGGVFKSGGFNDGEWLPLDTGDYTIQLVRIEERQGVIIAESNFSIVPYDKQTLSKMTAYFTVEGDPNKYYGSYTRKGNKSESVTAWIQSEKGETISGTVKDYMSNLEGVIDEKSWIGVTEKPFKTDPSGEPVHLGNLSGNPLPGVYNHEIIVDGKTIFHLKYFCF